MAKHILIFDLDGTLINSKKAHAEAYNLAFEKNRLERLPVDKIIPVFGIPVEDIIKKLYPNISSRRLPDCAKDQREIVIKKCLHLVRPIMDVAETLEVLAHKYVLSIVSTNKHENIIKLAKAGGIDPKMFRIIIGEDEVKRPKPAPDGILEVRKLITAPIGYFIGDTIYDLRAAKAAGIRSIGVLSGIGKFKQLWAEKPAHVISSVAELPNVLA